MTDSARWLDERRPPAATELRAVIDSALAGLHRHDGDADALHDRLAAAATAVLARVARGPSTRASAYSLLAADAILTYACEAAAEAGPDELDRLTARLDFAHFARLLEPAE